MTRTKDIGKSQETRVLYWIARFGYLSASQVARLVYRSQAGAKTLVHRKLLALTRMKFLKRQLVEGAYHYYLTTAGAHFISELHGFKAKGFVPNFGYFTHRQCANNYLIYRLIESDFKRSAITEYEIQTGRSPIVTVRGKVADSIMVDSGMAEWIEVENAYKNVSERNKCAEFCAEMLGDPENYEPLTDDIRLETVSFVCCNLDSLKRILGTLKEYVDMGRIPPGAYGTESIFLILYTDEQATKGESPQGVTLSEVLKNMD